MKNSNTESRFSSPEARLAIACLGYELGCADAISLPQGLDWERFNHFLDRNRLAPHFAVLVKRLPVDLPDEVRQKLKNARYHNLLYGDHCKLQVHQVLKALKDAGIPVIVLKGWAVIQWLYDGDHGQRYCEDIDILVPVRYKEAAESVLEKKGYSPVEELDPGFADRFLNAKAYVKQWEESDPWQHFSIGFHWGLTHFPYYDEARVDTAVLFDRGMPLQIAGVEVAELSREDQLIYTCAHLALHHRNEETLLQYFEIAAILHRTGTTLDWEVLISRARQWRYLAQIRVVLSTVNQLWKNSPDNELLGRICRLPIPWQERWLDRLVAGVKGNPIRAAFVEMLALPGITNKIRAIWFNLFPPRRYMEQRYNKGNSLVGLYFMRVRGAINRFFHSEHRSGVKIKPTE